MALTHLIPALFAVGGTIVLLGFHRGRAQTRWVLTMAPVAAAIAAFWALPFVWRRAYLNDMGWEKLEPWTRHSGWPAMFDIDLRSPLFPPDIIPVPGHWWGDVGKFLWPADLQWALWLAVVGIVASFVRRERAGMFLVVMAGLTALAFLVLPQGRLWNARLLPFYNLEIYLLAGLAIAFIGRAAAGAVGQSDARTHRHRAR